MVNVGSAEVDVRIRALAGDVPAAEARLRRLRRAPAPDWQLLRGHRLVEGRRLSDASLHAQYVYLTDVLITRCLSIPPAERMICSGASSSTT